MIITTQRLKIIPMSFEYLHDLHKLLSDRELTKFMVFNPKESIEETKAQIQKSIDEFQKEHPVFLDFAVMSGNTLVGDLSLYFFENDPHAAEFSWIISPDCSGKGYAFEAAKALMEYYSQHKGITRFIAQCDSENIPSIRLIEKLGLKLIDSGGTRFNRSAPGVERTEYTYELIIR